MSIGKLIEDMSYDLKKFCKKEKGISFFKIKNKEATELYNKIWVLGYENIYNILYKGEDYKKLI